MTARPGGDPTPIDRLTSRSLARATPTLVTGVSVLDELWTPADVVARVGDVEVPVSIVDGGDYMGARTEMMRVADYVAAVEAGGSLDGPRPYLAELSYDTWFPDLAADLVTPPELVGERFLRRVMYLGAAVHSQIHYHPAGSALLFGIHGRKVVRLYAPDQTSRLYKARRRTFSRVHVSSIGEVTDRHDAERFPRYADAEYVEYLIGPGDVLFIPVYWWHSIQNLDEMSLTAVYFWREEWRDTWRVYLPPTLPPAPMLATYVASTVAGTAKDLRRRARAAVAR